MAALQQTQQAYVQKTSNTDCTATSEATATTIVTAAAVTVDGNTPVLIECRDCAFGMSTTGVVGRIILHDGTNVVATLWAEQDWLGITSSRTGWTLKYRYTPSAGTYTYSIRGWVASAMTFRTAGGTGGTSSDIPFNLRVSTLAPPPAPSSQIHIRSRRALGRRRFV